MHSVETEADFDKRRPYGRDVLSYRDVRCESKVLSDDHHGLQASQSWSVYFRHGCWSDYFCQIRGLQQCRELLLPDRSVSTPLENNYSPVPISCRKLTKRHTFPFSLILPRRPLSRHFLLKFHFFQTPSRVTPAIVKGVRLT